jgi:predicted nucleotidyltransferase
MRPPEHCPILLEGVVGSQAYGLATPTSDIDKLGIFVQPTADLWLLNKPRETWNTDKDETDDYTYHEAEKYVRLGLKCNPTVLELLWLDEYTVTSTFGLGLIDRRSAFLSKSYVRNSYLGYATQQLTRILRRQNDPFDESKADAKNARHLWRLLRQGVELYTYGTMKLWLDSYHSSQCRAFGETVAEGDTQWARNELQFAENTFDRLEATSPLPDKPDTATVESWLVTLRSHMIYSTGGVTND